MGAIFGLAALVCWVMTEIKIFQDKEKSGVLHGIIGIVTCGIWAFIWGWINSGRYANKLVMSIWTVCWIVSTYFSFGQIMDMMHKGAVK